MSTCATILTEPPVGVRLKHFDRTRYKTHYFEERWPRNAQEMVRPCSIVVTPSNPAAPSHGAVAQWVERSANRCRTTELMEERSMSEERTYEVIEVESGGPLKAWIRGVSLEDAAARQLHNVARLPCVRGWVAAMPDVHWGVGATVGSVIPTVGAIIPAAGGVDVG